ncbi:MAG: bacillithiol biosynthesis deacetylase BshB2 [Alicyclobacillus sp.]|nr:bacillithiol biosynthesis deacetylase BshB2 [Alicyclobacillus sp.]
METGNRERQVLVVFPHPDDETLAVGGAIAMHAAAGTPVTYACYTLGQMGRNMGKPLFATRESLPLIREQELRAACQHLGITDLRLMGFRDKTLDFEDPEALAQTVLDLIQECQPSLVITYYPGWCVHPDHEALAAATVRALRKLPAGQRPKLQCQAFAQGYQAALGEPDVVYDAADVWERCYAAIRAHKSQTSAWVERIERALAGSPSDRDAAIGQIARGRMYTVDADTVEI